MTQEAILGKLLIDYDKACANLYKSIKDEFAKENEKLQDRKRREEKRREEKRREEKRREEKRRSQLKVS